MNDAPEYGTPTMNLNLTVLPSTFAVCRLAPNAPVPAWADEGFVSITRTPDELSIVCEQRHVPPELAAERDWRCLGVVGPLDFALTGILLSLARPLAERGISIFADFDLRYRLRACQGSRPKNALAALREQGHSVE